jgi:putative transposase
VIYAFINERKEYSVAKWALFFTVSRSGYYSHLNLRNQRDETRTVLKQGIKRIFDESGGTYGADRVCGILRRDGVKVSYRKIRQHMCDMGLNSIHNRHKRCRSLTDSRKSRGEGYPNLLQGQSFDKPRTAVCSDITYLKNGEGWLYLCVVKDIVSGDILGEATSDRMKKDLVIRAFLNAHARHQFARGTIFHSDRGSQYTSKAFMNLLHLYGIRQSFSRVGKPGDNSWAESFFATLKKECIHFKHFATRAELGQAVFAWIHCFYNTKRVQERLGYLSPKNYAALLMEDYKKAA